VPLVLHVIAGIAFELFYTGEILKRSVSIRQVAPGYCHVKDLLRFAPNLVDPLRCQTLDFEFGLVGWIYSREAISLASSRTDLSVKKFARLGAHVLQASGFYV
jgi:hypothetical protein